MRSQPLQAIIVGARRKRQGTGAFLANIINQEGCNIAGVVGSELSSAQVAVRELEANYAIKTHAYKDLARALDEHPAAMVVIASPYETHLNLLYQAAHANRHVFCEKPLFWGPASAPLPSWGKIEKAVSEITALFSEHKKILHLNTQWIYTLPYFMQLYPETRLLPENIDSLDLALSPAGTGISMFIDAAPHFISLLQALLGELRFQSLAVEFDHERKQSQLTGQCVHQKGNTDICLTLKQGITAPRHARYAINQKTVNRHIKMPDYSVSLGSDGAEILITDPTRLSVKDFITKIQTAQIDNPIFMNSMQCLYQIVSTATKA